MLLSAALAAANNSTSTDTTETAAIGFRLATVTVAPVPEQPTVFMAVSGAAALAAGALRRRITTRLNRRRY